MLGGGDEYSGAVDFNSAGLQGGEAGGEHRCGTELPGIDIFICTADPSAEPPSLVVSTVLSLLAYDYPTTKMSVYLSDDAGSELTFYALCEASRFAEYWLPFCRKFKVEPRSPAAYFSKWSDPNDPRNPTEWSSMKRLYDGMTDRIDSVVNLGKVPQEFREHKGFSEWNSTMTSRNHPPIIQILIDSTDEGAVDMEGNKLPTLVYMAREKSPQYHHNFKAGAMNSLMGLMYGCAVEDVLTGLTIHCRGWKSVYYNPARKGFLGVAPTTLGQTLVQYKRWAEGLLSIFASKYCAFIYGHGKKKLGLQMGYSIYGLWAANTFASLYYFAVPSICLLKGVSLFPKVSSIWFVPFAYVTLAKQAYSLIESLLCGDTLIGWWNAQRMWVFKRITSFLYGTIDTIFNIMGLSQTAFALTTKVADGDQSKRYKQEVMEFGASSPMFTIIATYALLNLICLAGGVRKLVMDEAVDGLEPLLLQLILSGAIVLVNAPVYMALLLRNDKGSMPIHVLFISIGFAMLACLLPIV